MDFFHVPFLKLLIKFLTKTKYKYWIINCHPFCGLRILILVWYSPPPSCSFAIKRKKRLVHALITRSSFVKINSHIWTNKMSPVIISETTNLYSINLHMKFFSEFAGKLDKNASIEGPITNIQYLSFFIVCYMFKIACAYKSIPGTSS